MNSVFVNYLGCGYEVKYYWVHCEFVVDSIYPEPKKVLLINHITQKAQDLAIEQEYDAWVADNALNEDYTDDELEALMYAQSKGLNKALDKH